MASPRIRLIHWNGFRIARCFSSEIPQYDAFAGGGDKSAISGLQCRAAFSQTDDLESNIPDGRTRCVGCFINERHLLILGGQEASFPFRFLAFDLIKNAKCRPPNVDFDAFALYAKTAEIDAAFWHRACTGGDCPDTPAKTGHSCCEGEEHAWICGDGRERMKVPGRRQDTCAALFLRIPKTGKYLEISVGRFRILPAATKHRFQ